QRAQVPVCIAEHGLHRSPLALRLLIDPVHQVIADFEPDIVAQWIPGSALEQEASLGTADLDLDLAAGIEHRLAAAELLEEQPQRVDVLADSHARPIRSNAFRAHTARVREPRALAQ